ncbi:MAG: hypothetical protein CME59_10700 [Halioglobus sp.]|nr:hypothetical protein [Halioglobus sp.]|tara:strand:+ start:1977 stop:2873 length:897 start_codon:yes stop_codon:yes gene_type:complete
MSTHRIIVYQYGKVGSTSITAALNGLRGVEAHQCHFLGEQAFADTLRRLVNPELSDYFFEHGSGQLLQNLRVYRYFQRREIDADPVTVLTLAREPFDWFRSAIAQDIGEHLAALRRMLEVRDAAPASEAEVVTEGVPLLLGRLLEAVQHFGSVDAMCEGARYPELRSGLDHADLADFRAFMFFVNTFLRPHLWYQSHFEPAIGVSLSALQPLASGALCARQAWGGVYLVRYESLQQGFRAMLEDIGLPADAKLPQRNLGAHKPLAAELAAAFRSQAAARLEAVCHSRDTRALGYPAPV